MILTQELWEEYTAAFPDEFSWEELMDAGLTAQACAAANATNWKLEQVLEDNQLLRIQNAELSAAMEIYARTEVKLVRQQNAELVDVLGRMINEHKLVSAKTLELAKNVYQSNRG